MACCLFPFVLPSFAPTAVPLVLISAFASMFFPYLPLSFVCFFSGSDYSVFRFFLSCSSLLRLTVAFQVLGSSFRSFHLLPFFLSDFSFSFPGSQYSVFCWFPFVLPCFAPAAVPQVITFCFRLRCFSIAFCFLSSASALGFQLLSFCFFRSFFFPVSASQWLLRFGLSALASLPFPLIFRLISHASFQVLLYLAFC